MKHLVQAIMILLWFAGIAIGKGFWALLAIFPPIGWYLVVHAMLVRHGIIGCS
jgi:hypothetical protein